MFLIVKLCPRTLHKHNLTNDNKLTEHQSNTNHN